MLEIEPEFLKNSSPEMRKEIQDIINKLYGTNPPVCINSLTQELLSKLINNLISGTEESINISNFTQEQKEALYAAIISILEQNSRSGSSGVSDEKIMKTLLQNLAATISNGDKKKQDELKFLQINEKKIKELNEIINKIVNYENYKMVTPAHVAGETRIQRSIKDSKFNKRIPNNKPLPGNNGGSGMGR